MHLNNSPLILHNLYINCYFILVLTYIQSITLILQFYRNFAVTSRQMVLMTLRYFASGSFLVVCGDFVGVHKSTASRTRVSAIARLSSKFIRFPETEEEISVTRQEFFSKYKFPRCIGVIDCTHINIRSPGGEDAEIYRN